VGSQKSDQEEPRGISESDKSSEKKSEG
jgi:hypothetical protein